MIRRMTCALVMALAGPAAASSLTVSGLIDGEDGTALDLDGRLSITEDWLIGAGIGRGESELAGEKFSGTSLRASTDLQFGAFFAGASAERWKDSGQLRTTTLRGELGWMSASGLALSALLTDRSLDITYAATVLGEPRELAIQFEGTGLGADVSWYGEAWTASLRFVEYDYGRNVQRVRNVINAPDTDRFPRIQGLIETITTRAAAAPDRELSLLLGRQFARSSLTGDLQLQRDALTGEESWSLGLTLGREMGTQFTLDATLGFTDGDSIGTVPWGGLALSLHSAR
jgi:hypothetical protein